MGASGKWLKSFISLKKPSTIDQEKVVDKSKKKWRLWRSSSEGFGTSMKSMNKGHGAVSEKSDSSFLLDDAFTAAMATVVRAPPKGFMVIKQEWAAIRIQALFRGFLARRASRALRAVVRLQAIFRGRQVRKQAAVTLRCMQALVRVQARVKARNVRMSPLGKDVHQAGTIKQAEQGWCDIPGSADEVKAKLQTRQEAAIKRERAMAYSLSAQQSRASASPNSRSTKAVSPLEHRSLDCRSLLERWMAAKPWENRSLPDMTPISSRKNEDLVLPSQTYKEHGLIKARRNAVTTRITAKPLTTSQSTPSSSSAMSSECMYDDSPVSASRTSGSPPSVPYTNTLVGETTEEKEVDKPSYMNFTESTKAKQRACRCSSQNSKRLLMEDCLSRSTTSAFLNGDTRSSSGSDPSINFWRDLYGTPQRTSYQRRYYNRR